MKIKIAAILLALFMNATNAAHFIQVGGLRVSAGAFYSVGTTLTTLNSDESNLSKLGIALIIFGVIIEGSETVSNPQSSNELSQAKITKKIVVDARAVSRKPELAKGTPMEIAVKRFETKRNLNFNDKTKVFAEFIAKLDNLAKTTKKNGQDSIAKEQVEEVLNENYSKENMQIASRFLMLNEISVN